MRLADVLGVELCEAVDVKLAKNAEKYPADVREVSRPSIQSDVNSTLRGRGHLYR